MSDITDKEFEKLYLPFYNNVNNYLNKYVIPDLVAFYLENAYSRHCLSECNLINHINSAVDIFNCRCDISRLIPKIKEKGLYKTFFEIELNIVKYGFNDWLKEGFDELVK